MYGPHRQGLQPKPYNRQSYGREFSTGRMGDQLDQNQHPDQEDINRPKQEPIPQTSREPQHNGTFAVIPPNQTKREKLLSMANKEEEEYNRFLESRRSGPLCLTPKKLGGQTSEERARQQQQLTQSQSKYQKKFQRDEYRRRQKEEEDAKLQQMKDIQRKKAEKLEEKRRLEERERKERWEKDMIKKNSEFLDQFSQHPKSSYSYNSYEQTPTALKQDEDWVYQQALKESMETKREEDQRRQKVEMKQQWQERNSSYEEELDWQTFYSQQLKEAEERRLQQMKDEHYRKKMEEEQWRQEVEKTNLWQASKQSHSSYKQQLKEEEERKLQQIKEEQHIQSELLEIKKEEEEKKRQLSEREEQRRVNNAFLDKLQRLNTRQHEHSGESNTWA